MFLTDTPRRRPQVHFIAITHQHLLSISLFSSSRSRHSLVVASSGALPHPRVQKVHSSFTSSSTPCRCVAYLHVAFRRRSSSRASMEEMQYTLNSSVTLLEKPSIDFCVLDEKMLNLGEGVAKGIWLMIRDVVAQEMHGVATTLSEVLKAVKYFLLMFALNYSCRNDCGIWVSQWMILLCYFGTNHKWVVNDYTKMELAVDLVNGEHNPKCDMINDLAVIDWNNKMQYSVMQS